MAESHVTLEGLTQKFVKHAMEARFTSKAWIRSGSVTVYFAMLRSIPPYDMCWFFAGQSGSMRYRSPRMTVCSPNASQYTMRQVTKFATTPARTRAISTPKSRPERTMESAEARLSGGARSAAKGMRIWGTTDMAPIRKVSTSKTTTEEVRGRPMVRIAARAVRTRIKGRRRTRSPSGEISSRPVA